MSNRVGALAQAVWKRIVGVPLKARIILVIVAVSAFGSVGLIAFAPEPDHVVADAQGVPVSSMVTQFQRLSPEVRLYGRVETPNAAQLTALISAPVAALAAREGDRVDAGAVLVALDETDMALALERAEAELDQAQADLEVLLLGGRRRPRGAGLSGTACRSSGCQGRLASQALRAGIDLPPDVECCLEREPRPGDCACPAAGSCRQLRASAVAGTRQRGTRQGVRAGSARQPRARGGQSAVPWPRDASPGRPGRTRRPRNHRRGDLRRHAAGNPRGHPQRAPTGGGSSAGRRGASRPCSPTSATTRGRESSNGWWARCRKAAPAWTDWCDWMRM